MPKIEMNFNFLLEHCKKQLSVDQLIELLPIAKAEFDGYSDDHQKLKIEFNDTNRPDLWSTMGLVRQINTYITEEPPTYDIFDNKNLDPSKTILVEDGDIKGVRPFITAFIAEGPAVTENILNELIDSQEKLCHNFGKRREIIAMGIYREDLIKYPIRYKAVDPRNTKFIPLDCNEEMNLIEILEKHPKGIEFASIVKAFKKYPLLIDSSDSVLSFPPIINSNHLGAVKLGDKKLFIEFTGTKLDGLLLATSVMACNLKDLGYKIIPVTVQYPYSVSEKNGKTLVTPDYFQQKVAFTLDYIEDVVGEKISFEEIRLYLKRMGCEVIDEKGRYALVPPVYRNDFMHQVDIIEDIVIGKGLDKIKPIEPSSYTTGRYSKTELFARSIIDIFVGLGYQEMIYNYLSSKKNCITNMNLDEAKEQVIEIENPMSDRFNILRNSILPNLLDSEHFSINSIYPHKIFEVGEVVIVDENENHGCRTQTNLGVLMSNDNAVFNDLYSHLVVLFQLLKLPVELKPCEDPRFIPGRVANILSDKKEIGIIGEIHPVVLENWGIKVPTVVFEIDLHSIINKIGF